MIINLIIALGLVVGLMMLGAAATEWREIKRRRRTRQHAKAITNRPLPNGFVVADGRHLPRQHEVAVDPWSTAAWAQLHKPPVYQEPADWWANVHTRTAAGPTQSLPHLPPLSRAERASEAAADAEALSIWDAVLTGDVNVGWTVTGHRDDTMLIPVITIIQCPLCLDDRWLDGIGNCPECVTS